jgi:hypothetical protein
MVDFNRGYSPVDSHLRITVHDIAPASDSIQPVSPYRSTMESINCLHMAVRVFNGTIRYEGQNSCLSPLPVYRAVSERILSLTSKPLLRRLIPAHASGHLSNLILWEWRIAPPLIHYQQGWLDFYGIQPTPTHGASQARQCDVASPSGIVSPICRCPIAYDFLAPFRKSCRSHSGASAIGAELRQRYRLPLR